MTTIRRGGRILDIIEAMAVRALTAREISDAVGIEHRKMYLYLRLLQQRRMATPDSTQDNPQAKGPSPIRWRLTIGNCR